MRWNTYHKLASPPFIIVLWILGFNAFLLLDNDEVVLDGDPLKKASNHLEDSFQEPHIQ